MHLLSSSEALFTFQSIDSFPIFFTTFVQCVLREMSIGLLFSWYSFTLLFIFTFTFSYHNCLNMHIILINLLPLFLKPILSSSIMTICLPYIYPFSLNQLSNSFWYITFNSSLTYKWNPPYSNFAMNWNHLLELNPEEIPIGLLKKLFLIITLKGQQALMNTHTFLQLNFTYLNFKTHLFKLPLVVSPFFLSYSG